MKFFSADQHFGHEQIIKHCNRPFKNAKVMNDTIIRNYNDVVSDDDDVYIAGDLSILTVQHKGTIETWIQRLNGRIHLILGNHDIKNPWIYLDMGIWSVHAPHFEVEEFIVVHDPALSQININKWFLCGHVHNLFHIHRNCLNIGVDVNKFRPISIDEVREVIKNYKSSGKE